MSEFNINGPISQPLDVKVDLTSGLGPKQRGFLEVIGEAVDQVEQDEAKANQAATDLAVGRRKTLHETMIAVEKADISFRMLLAVRNKVVSAYQEVMRMQF